MPNSAEHIDGLLALYDQGKLQEALREGLELAERYPDVPLILNIIGAANAGLGRWDEAIANYKKALQIKPDYAEAHSNLGDVLYRLKKHKASLLRHGIAVALAPDYRPLWVNLAKGLNGISFGKYDRKIEEILLGLLEQKTIVRPNQLVGPILSLLKLHPLIDEALRISAAGGIRESAPAISSKLSSVPLFLRIIELCPIPDLEVEHLLTELRKALLLGGGFGKDKPGVLDFQTSLALHCFTNEYVFGETMDETSAVEALQADLEAMERAGAEPDPFKISCFASYRPLHRYAWFRTLKFPDGLQRLFKRQVEEVLEEESLRPAIPCLKKIDAPVSVAVREQYEENPYPRWVHTRLPARPLTISEVVKNLKLRLHDDAHAFSERPDILVAGCGTGQHSIVTASRFANSHVLAVDLSLGSLSHALRKTHELGISNIEYMQADILDLGNLDRQFDIVESVGVLHHMADPIAGWKVLVDCAKPNGLMKIGLYSELGRKPVVEARAMISNMGLGSRGDSIRKFRQHILNREAGEDLEQLAKLKDFFSTSSCRDLLFHVQEHRFTLPQIKDALCALGLTFVGFEMSGRATMQKLKREHPDPQAAYSLDAWHEYETANPNTFRGLYQFWVQKNG